MQTIDPITWEAAATLITGILAVGAAIYVGSRQAGIAATQADIQREQTAIQKEQTSIQGEVLRLEQLKLKADLYDRRLEVYNAARTYLDTISQTGKVPGWVNTTTGESFAEEIYEKFLASFGAAEFLCSEQAVNELEDLWKDSIDLVTAYDLLEVFKRKDAESEVIVAGRVKASLDHGQARSKVLNHYAALKIAFDEDLKLTLPTKS